MVGYATAYTMAPVFSLVLDRDVNEDIAMLYPELYKDLTKVRYHHVTRCLVFDTPIGTRALVQDVFRLALNKRVPR